VHRAFVVKYLFPFMPPRISVAIGYTKQFQTDVLTPQGRLYRSFIPRDASQYVERAAMLVTVPPDYRPRNPAAAVDSFTRSSRHCTVWRGRERLGGDRVPRG
jgi:hypothetical protein